MKKISILMMAAMPLFFACKKSNNDGQNNGPDPAAKKLQADIVGKWQIPSLSLTGPTAFHNGIVTRSTNHLGLKTFTKPHNITVNGIQPAGGGGLGAGYIEFLSDSTYMIYDSQGNFTQGKFNALTGDSISLSNFGSLGGIKLGSSTLDFKLHYSAGSGTVTISANKAPAVASDSRTALLCRSWYLTNADAGGDIIGSTDSYYNPATQQYEDYTIDSLTFVITTSGTYIVQQFNKGTLKNADVANWKWHSTQSDRFVYYWDNDPIDEAHDYVIIRENTKTILKLSEIDEENNNEELKYTLLPAH